MTERPDEGAARPLPRSWLPDAQPSRDDPVWEERVLRVMAAAGPELARLERRHAGAAGWRSTLAAWWKPAAAVAAASTALLFLTGRPPSVAEAPSGAVPLGLVAAEGDPVALWEAQGAQAHPVLAFIAIQQPGAVGESTSSHPAPQEDGR